ncbi:hypothetical protein BT69DRAFT_1327857 [Atractiella rhizophila]|nr:hypothetical protein BT69DRAFT_1327857 [Atractiella rhizophila]
MSSQTHAPSPSGAQSGLTAADEAVQLWSDIYESNLPPPDRPHFDGPIFDEKCWGLGHLSPLQRLEALSLAIQRASLSALTVHAHLLATLSCFSSDEEKENAPTRFFSLTDHLSSLFRLVAATRPTPSRWGEQVMPFIPKGKDRPPTAADSRPLSLFVMFRRLWEILFLPALSSEDPSSWNFTHMAQAGFKRGFSCLSNLLIVDSAARTRQRPIAIFLDFERAFPPAVLLQLSANSASEPLSTISSPPTLLRLSPLKRWRRDFRHGIAVELATPTPKGREFLFATDLNEYSVEVLNWTIENLAEDGDELAVLRVTERELPFLYSQMYD